MRRLMGTLLGTALAAFVAAPLGVLSQTFPAKPIRMLVPYPPGGIDPAARLMGPRMSEVLGQPIVIENLPGANGFIGTERAARSAPDGYTILFATSSTLIAGVFLSKNVPFDPLKDLAPITNLYEPLHLIAVHASLPVNSVRELIDYAKKYPGKLSYSSSGIGSVFHLNTELFKQAAGVDIVHVPYKGIGQAATDLAVGRVEVGFMGYTNFRPFLADAKLKLLAVLDPKRYPRLPELPALAEILPSFRKSPSWIGLLAPAGLPQAILNRLHAATVRALNSPEVQAYMEQNSNVTVGNTPEEFAKSMRSDMEITAKLVKAIGIQPE